MALSYSVFWDARMYNWCARCEEHVVRCLPPCLVLSCLAACFATTSSTSASRLGTDTGAFNPSVPWCCAGSRPHARLQPPSAPSPGGFPFWTGAQGHPGPGQPAAVRSVSVTHGSEPKWVAHIYYLDGECRYSGSPNQSMIKQSNPMPRGAHLLINVVENTETDRCRQGASSFAATQSSLQVTGYDYVYSTAVQS